MERASVAETKKIQWEHPKGVSIRLLGRFELRGADHALIKLPYEKGCALLAYLAGEDGWHSREELADLFWPDLPMESARSNLRLVLMHLRKCINDHENSYLLADRNSLRLNHESKLWVDLQLFMRTPLPDYSEDEPGAFAADAPQWKDLLGLYRGSFLQNFSLPACPEFEAWLGAKRETVHQRALAMLERLADCHERSSHYVQALSFAHRYVELDPWNEEGYRRTMRLYALNGQVGAALAQFSACARILNEELGVQPSEDTVRLAERLRNGEFSRNLPAEPAVLAPPASTLPAPIAEWRQVTVVYCKATSLVSSDPDQAISDLERFKEHCGDILQRFSGHVVFPGIGGAFAYFGYPQASESAARQAVRAALAVVRETREAILEVRAGIHTGLVVTGKDRASPDASGEISALAVRLHWEAGDGDIVLSADTKQLVKTYFHCTEADRRQIADVPNPLKIYIVQRENDALAVLESETTCLPLVGRDIEFAKLASLWSAVRQNVQHAVLIQGEAGVGKSRLVKALKDSIRDEDSAICELRCLPEFQGTRFQPLVAMLESSFGFASGDSPETRLRKLSHYIDQQCPCATKDTVEVLAQLLSLPPPRQISTAAFSLTADARLDSDVLCDTLLQVQARQPILLILEDLHWADPATVSLLAAFLRTKRNAPVLTVITCRTDCHYSWFDAFDCRLSLQPLSRSEVKSMVQMLAYDLSPELARQVVARADGIPLFVEEMVKFAAKTAKVAVPATLLDLLTARLDEMGLEKHTAQLAATIGREFSFDVLSSISPLAPSLLEESLRKLQYAGLVERNKQGFFHFRQDLIQEVAYQSLTKHERQQAHLRAAEAFKDESIAMESAPEMIVNHLTKSDQFAEVIHYWLTAGRRAVQNSENLEAIIHFKSGLQLLRHLPPNEKRDRQEYLLQLGLGAALGASQGYGSIEARQAYDRAVDLCAKEGSGPSLFHALWGTWRNLSAHSTSSVLPAQLLRISKVTGNAIHKQNALCALGITLLRQAKFGSARICLDRALALYEPSHHFRMVELYGLNSRVLIGSHLAFVLWLSGFPDQAGTCSEQTILVAKKLNHPYSLACAFFSSATLLAWMTKHDETLAMAEELYALTDMHGFHIWRHAAEFLQNWALHMLNRVDGLVKMSNDIIEIQSLTRGEESFLYVLLIQAYMHSGQIGAALKTIEEGFLEAEATGNFANEAELYRLREECLAKPVRKSFST